MFRENKTRTRISYEDNTKIIALIKSKINPLHSKTNYFPRLKSEKAYPKSHRHSHKRQQQQLIKENQLKFLLAQPKIQIIEKAKSYVQEKKKFLQHKQIQNKLNLSEYVRLFNKGEQEKQKKIMEQFLKMKRQSMDQMSQEESKHYQVPSTQIKEFPRMNEQQQLQLNARIRRRINHKKIIALAKHR